MKKTSSLNLSGHSSVVERLVANEVVLGFLSLLILVFLNV